MMALEWCVHYGVLSDSEAKAANERVQKWKAEGGRTGFSQPTSTPPSSSSSAPAPKKVKTTIVDEGVSDVGIAVGSGTQGLGIASLN